MSDWSKALDAKIDLARDVRAATAGVPLIEDLSGFEPLHLDRSEPVWVEPDIATIVEFAADGFEAEPLLETDLLCPDGFALLGGPGWTDVTESAEEDENEAGPEPYRCRAIMWNEETVEGEVGQVRLRFYSAGDGSGGLFDYRHVIWRYGESLPRIRTEYRGPEDTDNARIESYPTSRGEGPAVERIGYRLFQVLMRFAQQRITTTSRARAARPTRRRAQRAGHPERDVTVIQLRRSKSKRKEGEGVEVNWSHRWLVRAFWRNQWYPSLKEHRQIPIAPHVKGPEDKELVVTDRAWDFRR